jgi:putative tryptophan/tyrosine transport system substrate-binding protein
MNNRRELITLLGGAAAVWALAARAQTAPPMRRIGVLTALAEKDLGWQRNFAGFVAGLREKGWSEGRDFRFQFRYVPGGNLEHLRVAAGELVALAPDVILAVSPAAGRFVADRTRQIPVVFLLSTDPVAEGLVASVSRPGGNVTGFTQSDYSLGGKWPQLLNEMVPTVTALRVIMGGDASWLPAYLRSIEQAAQTLNISVTAIEIHNQSEIEQKITALEEPNVGLVFPPHAFTSDHRPQIIELVTRLRLPSIYFARFFVLDGGLMSYGIDQPHLFRQAGSYVDRILRGTKPADLPAQSPTKFELVINIKTAKKLGLNVPDALLARADEVIE